jgi:hypothetical protein
MMGNEKTSLKHRDLLEMLGIDVPFSLKYGDAGLRIDSLILGAALLVQYGNKEQREEGERRLKIIQGYLSEQRSDQQGYSTQSQPQSSSPLYSSPL